MNKNLLNYLPYSLPGGRIGSKVNTGKNFSPEKEKKKVVGASNLELSNDISMQNIEKAKVLVREIHILKDTNILYLKSFQLLKLGGIEAEIPRLVVFGQQSMGKTTLLDYIMGGPIGYSSTDTGTKQPVVIILKPSETNEVKCFFKGCEMNILELQNEMKTHMASQGDNITKEELDIEIAIPGGVHAVFVDLPGLKEDSRKGADLTRAVVREYVQNNPNDLYILVKKASDDPANWPWMLKEFILTSPPKGLGLTERQTVVVGTRAKEFLLNERTDIRKQTDLLERVKKRAVKDANGNALPLYLLELFSLSIEEKDSLDFVTKKVAMSQQISSRRQEVLQLLNGSFEEDNVSLEARQELHDFFDADKFKKELNNKFQALLSSQLANLERKLIVKKATLQRKIIEMEDQMTQQSSQSVQECIKLYIRELIQIVMELITGNYLVFRFEDSGKNFLNSYGANLKDNLVDGHKLACELFSNKDQYDPDFLEKSFTQAENILALEAENRMNNGSDESFEPKSGNTVRYILARDESCLFGVIHSAEISLACPSSTSSSAISVADNANKIDVSSLLSNCTVNDELQQPNENPAFKKSTEVTATFYSRVFSRKESNNSYREKPSNRNVEKSRLVEIIPLLKMISATNTLPPEGYRCWYRNYRGDGWLGAQPVALVSIEQQNSNEAGTPCISTVSSSYLPTPNSFPSIDSMLLNATCILRELKYVYLNSPINKNSAPFHAKIIDLFIDNPRADAGFDKGFTPTLTPLQRIAGPYAEEKLLNHYSITHLGNWLEFHISNLEPEKKFSDAALLQMARSVRNVIDKADLEPLVADLLQVNVRGGMLHVVRLAACAGAAALRRILRAANAEMHRKIQSGDLSTGLLLLSNNSFFTEELDNALENYCRSKAWECTKGMHESIFEQTHAINFDMIEKLFDGCKKYENDFLGSSEMDNVIRRVKESLRIRKSKLSAEDIFAKDFNAMPNNMIYDEVRVQFWVVKIFLVGPLNRKLYMYYVKDVKDGNVHLASDDYKITCESGLEKNLQEILLCEKSSGGRFIRRSDDELMKHFGFLFNKEELNEKLNMARRTSQYVDLVIEAISKLRSTMNRANGVDFLMRLDISSTLK